MRRALAILALLAVSCCGVASRVMNVLQGEANPRVYVHITDRDIWVDGKDAAAMCHHWLGEEARIYVERSVPAFALRAVMAHELLHAAGLRGHPFAEPDCYNTPHGCVSAYANGPCPEEVAWLRACGEWRAVYVVDAELAEATAWAVDMWNSAAGVEVFALVEETPCRR